MTTAIETDKEQIVREVLDIVHQCEADGMEMAMNMEVCLYLRDEYGYDRSDATELLIGALLIDELNLMN